MTEVVDIEEAEKQRMLKKCEKIVKHGINVFIDRQLIYNLPEQVCVATVCHFFFAHVAA
jgi:T-complex protein 1 subunit beta